MTDKIRFAQLSFWFSHGHSLASAAQSHAQAELACVWDEDTERGAAAAQKYGGPFIADLDELLARDDVDAVGICSPTQLHGEHIIRAAEAGKHCLVEKPFTRTVAQADEAIRAAQAAGVQVMPAYNLRFSQSNEKLKEIVDSGILGPLYHVRRRHGQMKYGPFGYDAERIVNDPASPWGHDPHAEGRRCLLHAGSHAVFWMLWMFGMPESVVSLSVARVPGLPAEDNNVSLFRYADGGPLVTLQSSQTETAAPLTTEIYGFEGAVVGRGDVAARNPDHRPVQVVEDLLLDGAGDLAGEPAGLPDLLDNHRPVGLLDRFRDGLHVQRLESPQIDYLGLRSLPRQHFRGLFGHLCHP